MAKTRVTAGTGIAGALGLRRFPLVTVVVLAVTAACAVAQALVPGMLAALERAPVTLHGQWWRLGTSLFVQDGGLIGTLSNLLFLVLVGAMAEQVLTRPSWLLHYFAPGVATEFVACAWQPTGAGNSIAICGLAGALAVTLWRGAARPRPGGRADARAAVVARPHPAMVPILMLWCGALAGTLSPAVSAPAVVAGVVLAGLARIGRRRGLAVERPAAVVIALTGAGLAAATNVHGAALLIGTATRAATALAAAIRHHPRPPTA